VEEALKKALATPAESHSFVTPGHLGSAAYPTNSASTTRPVSAPAQLSTLSDMLASGDKREAVEYAATHGLWSHALIIASSLGPDLWKETVNRFIKEEVNGNGVACLTASYALFAGPDSATGESPSWPSADYKSTTCLPLRTSRTIRAKINGGKSSLLLC
jgi:hypothetical protein